MEKPMGELAIITVVYNNYSDFEDYFESLQSQKSAQPGEDFHVYIVDLSEEPKDIDRPEWATVVLGDNKGYAHGLRIGYEKARSDGYENFVYMNNDTTVAKDFVSKTLKSIQNHPVTLIGGKIYYYPGYEYHTDRYDKEDRGSVIWYAGGTIDWKHALTDHIGVDEVDTGQCNEETETEFVTGCFMAFDQALVDTVGNIDDSYFMYYEDADWSVRARRHGASCVYDPEIVLWHKNAQSTGGSGSEFHISQQRISRLRFGIRYAPWRTKLHLTWNFLRER